jgi:hypothetical protein
VAFFCCLASVVNAEPFANRVLLHLDDADPARQELVLNSAANINRYYQHQGE